MTYDRNPDFAGSFDLRKPADERNAVTILSSIYLEAGLPLEAAVRSALADLQSVFGTLVLCRS